MLIDDPHADVFNLVGKLFDDTYQVVRVVGAGSVGVVYEAMQTKLRARRALKVLRVEGIRDPERMLERFWREARASTSLRNAGAVEVHDARVDRVLRRPYFAMDLLDGISLHTQWSLSPAKQMPVAEGLGCVRQVAECMAVAHAAGIVHRDLKPENIFLSRDHSVKVLDFGCALIAQEPRLTAPGTMMGVPLYHPPEQLDFVRTRQPDPRMDVYALGVTLYHVLSGQYVYPLHRDPLVVARHVYEGPPRDIAAVAPQLPVPVHSLIRKAIARDPEERFASMEALASEIGRLLKSGDVSLKVYPHSATMARTRPAREKPTLVDHLAEVRGESAPSESQQPTANRNVVPLMRPDATTKKTVPQRPKRGGHAVADVGPAQSAPVHQRPVVSRDPVRSPPVVAAGVGLGLQTPARKRVAPARRRRSVAPLLVASGCIVVAAIVAFVVYSSRERPPNAGVVPYPDATPPVKPPAPAPVSPQRSVTVEEALPATPPNPVRPQSATQVRAETRAVNVSRVKRSTDARSTEPPADVGPQLDDNLNGLANPFSK